MKDGAFQFGGVWGVATALLLAVISVVLGYVIGWKNAAPEIFAAFVTVAVGGVVVEGLLSRSRLASERRAWCDALIKRIDALVTKSRAARELLIAHRSARTWGEQMRDFLALDEVIDEVVAEIRALYPDASSQRGSVVTGAINELLAARDKIQSLGEEYRVRHDQVGWEQKQFEKRKEAASKWSEVQVLHTEHWQTLQNLVPRAAQFVARGNLATLPHVTTLEERLLQSARLLVDQFTSRDPKASGVAGAQAASTRVSAEAE